MFQMKGTDKAVLRKLEGFDTSQALMSVSQWLEIFEIVVGVGYPKWMLVVRSGEERILDKSIEGFW